MEASKNSIQITPGKIISQRFVISKLIGQGSFGSVYQGHDIQKGYDVAIKLEEFVKIDEKMKKENLLKEAKFLHQLKGEPGIPEILYFVKTETKRILVMSLLGMNLESVFQGQKRRFCLKTVLSLADQMLTRLEQIHSKDILHRDLKPENFLISNAENDDCIYLVDFGLSKKFKNKGVHNPFKKGIGLVGTARYASLSAHLGNDQCRKDDLESLAYILIYFLKGNLPWMSLSAKTKEEKHQLIINKKKTTTYQKLCEGLPFEFEQYLIYVRNLKFEENPNYNFLKNLFKKVALTNNFLNGFQWRSSKHINFSEKQIDNDEEYDSSEYEESSQKKQNLKSSHYKHYLSTSFHRPGCFNPRISKYSDFAKSIVKLEEADSEEEEPELEDNGNSKAHSSKTNNHSSKANNRMNQTNYNYIDEKDYDSFQLFEEFNVGFDNDVTLFTKMDFMNLKHCEKKCLSDLNKKTFNHYVTFSIYLNGEEDLEEEENFLTKNTNEYTQRNTKIIDRINLLGCNEIKKHLKF